MAEGFEVEEVVHRVFNEEYDVALEDTDEEEIIDRRETRHKYANV